MTVELKHENKIEAGVAGSIRKTNLSWERISIPLTNPATSESQRFFLPVTCGL